MFYCDDCATKRKWPNSLSRSRGACEVCGKDRSCNDVRSSLLPAEPRSPKAGVAKGRKLRIVSDE